MKPITTILGGSKMVQVLYVGQYKEGGKITTIQWRYFMEWCKTECNKIIVYSKMPYNTICTKFPLYCNINELQSPDELLDIYAFEINIFNIAFWEYIKEYNYNIDIADDISHIYFFWGNRNIASLEIVDYENYVLIEEPISHDDIFLLNRKLILENIQFCSKGKADIDDLLQGEGWKALGT